MKNVILELTRIVQNVALVESLTEQVTVIVNSISEVIDADVCSLYRLKANHSMQLVASHGLQCSSDLTIPAGKGLVGLVAKTRHPINIANAHKHPDYFYAPQAHEEQLKGFCGVPLVRAGEVTGVLVVQSHRAKVLGKEKEAFLVTLASQLALLLTNLPNQQKPTTTNLRVAGVKGAPGLAIGTVRFVTMAALKNVPDAPCDNIEETINEWRDLLTRVKMDISAEQQALSGELATNVSSIFDAYQMLLSDPSLNEKVEMEIRAGHWLPGALKIAIHFFSELFRAMDDPYLKARHEDILQLGDKLFHAWSGHEKGVEALSINEPVVLVGSQVSISQIASIPLEKLAGIVCFEGSSLSHTAVVANALGVPAVMGVGNVKELNNGEQAIVDGNEGAVILKASDAIVREYQTFIGQQRQVASQLTELRDKPAQTTDGQRIRLLTNTGLLADITPGLKNGAEGIGLYRTELTFMVSDSFPSEQEQVEAYQRVFEAYGDKPIYMRTLDIGGDKQLPYFPIENEENPALGWRGIRFSLDNVQLLMTQVRAMLRAAEGAENLHIMLPMVSAIEQLDSFRALLTDACQQLRGEGHQVIQPKVGMMVEVPAAISQLPLWKDRIDFVSIGSNDLSQYLLATDRNNAHVAGLFDHLHPAVLHEVKRTVDAARDCQLPLSLCGEMGSDPAAVVLLIGMGVRTLSMSAAKLPHIKSLIRGISCQQAEQLLAEAMTMTSSRQIRQWVNSAIAG